MPIYAFQCAACGHHFDRLQRMSDADPTTCPECGKDEVSRQLTAPQFRLAGGGWYETDFKGANDTKRNLADSSSSTPAAPAPMPASPAPAAKPSGTSNSSTS